MVDEIHEQNSDVFAAQNATAKSLATDPPVPSETDLSKRVPEYLWRGRHYVDLSIDMISPNSSQPRKEFSAELLQELAESLVQHGMLQPILVRPLISRNGYEIIYGERRWRAAKIAGWSTLRVLVENLTDTEVLQQAVIENEIRQDLSRLEKADGIAAAFNKLKDIDNKLSVETFAKRIGMKLTYVQDKLTVSRMPEYLREVVRRRPDGERQALIVFRAKHLQEPQKQRLAGRVIGEKLSVKQVEAEVASFRSTHQGLNAVKAIQKTIASSKLSLEEYAEQRNAPTHISSDVPPTKFARANIFENADVSPVDTAANVDANFASNGPDSEVPAETSTEHSLSDEDTNNTVLPPSVPPTKPISTQLTPTEAIEVVESEHDELIKSLVEDLEEALAVEVTWLRTAGMTLSLEAKLKRLSDVAYEYAEAL